MELAMLLQRELRGNGVPVSLSKAGKLVDLVVGAWSAGKGSAAPDN